jgi:ankyrin repeat protein
MYAVKHGHLGTVEQLLSNRVVHANMLCQEARAQQSCVSDRDSTTILMLAAREGHADVVKLLLSHNADLLAKVLSLLALLVEKYKCWHRRRFCCSCFCWRASNNPLVLIA